MRLTLFAFALTVVNVSAEPQKPEEMALLRIDQNANLE